MAFKVPFEGLLQLLDQLRQGFNSGVPTIQRRLYQNDFTPSDTSTLASFTESTFPGYAAISMFGWSIPTMIAGRALTAATPLVFLCTGGGPTEDVYGYYDVDPVTFKVLAAERLPGAPITMVNAGDVIPLNPTFTYKSEN